jgi:iron(III) transport system ATP-binding protein
MSEVRITGVSKMFGSTVAVDDITFTIPDGAFASFLGPSGCGKTTTLRMVAGLEHPSAGEISIGGGVVSGDDVFVLPEDRQIGMVFQSYAVWPHLTVFDNVAFPLKVRRRPKALIREQTEKALATVRLDGLAERYPAQLSGGQQQRIALARAIVFEPRLLLLDEPLSNLDAKLREQMRTEMRELQQRLEITTLYVTHDQQEALALSDVVMVMDQGRIVQIGPPKEIYQRPANRFVADFVGWANFLDGAVVDANTVSVLGVDMKGATIPSGLARGASVHVSVRPDDVKLLAHGQVAASRSISAQVKTVLFMGQHKLCELVVGEHFVQAHVDAGADLAVGSAVSIEFDPARMLVIGK